MLLVVKFGGSLLSEGIPEGLLNELPQIIDGHRIVLVHGGGAKVTEYSERLGIEPRFVTSPKGFRSRYTDEETSEVFTMVIAGLINKKLVSSLQKKGVNALGLCGLDGALLRAKRKKQIIALNKRGRRVLLEGDYSGKIYEVNSNLINLLLENGYLPIVSPLAIGEGGEHLNVDGDRAAASIATALNADKLILLTDTEGVLINGKTVPSLSLSGSEEILKEIGAGMITKLHASIVAIKSGVPEVIIGFGRGESPI